ncbi:hypothetical protein IU449_16150 [Nocardia higoensis]|uniref:Uncharacterized protein n=1 Tax=Nocardia higoensis TaxID=228599 RepID=A0ABS0DC51_9NOCA|nr:hypothetical protein [Nocardia higoensis]MBF6356056.1 hypothetical protein [Nocardia higoensis]
MWDIIVVFAVVAGAATLAFCLVCPADHIEDPPREGSAPREPACTDTRPIPPWVHTTPPRPLSITQAHQVMQDHIDCPPWLCGMKAAATQTLRESGRITLRRMPLW